MFLVLFAVLVTSLIQVLGHAGETHTTDTTENDDSTLGISLSLEQIYIVTFLTVIGLAFILEYRGIVKDRSLVYKFIVLGLVFLTVDFVIYKEYFA
jgi:hypothetical protein